MTESRQLEIMKLQDIEKISRKTLVDVSAIEIKRDLPQEEKILSYIEQVQNPYCFLCGNTPVKVCFNENGPDMGALLAKFFIRSK